jgi:hypothetical protein
MRMKMMQLTECRPLDEIFSWQDEDATEAYVFNASALQRAIDCKEVVGEELVIPLGKGWVDYVQNCRGVEQWKLDRLVDPWLSKPILGVLMPDGSTLSIDGHHRTVKTWQQGRIYITVLRFTLAQVMPYVVVGIPEEIAEALRS